MPPIDAGWRFDPPIVAACGLAALSYGVLWIRDRVRADGSPPRWWHLAAWIAGLAVAATALLSPLAVVDDQLFWVHMVQHELLMFLVPPLLLVAVAPLEVRWAARNSGHIAPQLHQRLRHPLGLWILSSAVLWLWHIPRAYDLAVVHQQIHALEHASLLGAFLLYWWPLLSPNDASPTLHSLGSRAFYLLAGGSQAALLGALLTFARTPVYAPYLQSSAAFGFTALEDQQLGGALMLFSGSVLYAVAAALTIRDTDGRRPTSRQPGLSSGLSIVSGG